MNPIFEFLFSQYKNYSTIDITLEITAVIFGFLSVWYSKKNNILVFPTGMISTAIFVYLLIKWALLGDMLINLYYFIMSIYGWYIWSKKVNNTPTQITKTTKAEQWQSVGIFGGTIFFVILIYFFFNKLNHWAAFVDTFTTGVFFVGMWLMAKRKLENWLYWIVGNVISVPLYFYKGLTFTSFQFIVFTFMALLGYKAWNKHLNNNPQIVKK